MRLSHPTARILHLLSSHKKNPKYKLLIQRQIKTRKAGRCSHFKAAKSHSEEKMEMIVWRKIKEVICREKS